MYSLHRRLLWSSAGLLCLMLAAGAVWLDRRVASNTLAEFDVALQAAAQTLVSLTDQEDGRIEFDYEAKFMPAYERDERPDLFEFWLEDGSVLLRSRGLRGDLPRLLDGPAIGDAETDGRRLRVVTTAFVSRVAADGSAQGGAPGPGSAPGLVLSVARDRHALDLRLGELHALVFGTAAVTLLLALLVLTGVSRWGFAKVGAIATRVAHLDPHAAAPHLRVDDVPSELRPFVDQVQALLVRARAAMQRERRFTGHVAHELRTPIAELRSLATMAMRWPDDRAAVVRYFDDVDQIAAGMESVIEDLMLLARCGAGVEAVRMQSVALLPAVNGAWAGLEPAARARGLRLTLRMAPDLVVESDPGKLAIVLSNLLGNAVAHAASGTEVVCEAEREGGHVSLRLTNVAADRLAPEVVGRLTEPFVGGARSARHAGLGLALVAAVAELLRLRVQVSASEGDVFCVEVANLVAMAVKPSAGLHPSSPSATLRQKGA